jgi:hypothetical protein
MANLNGRMHLLSVARVRVSSQLLALLGLVQSPPLRRYWS